MNKTIIKSLTILSLFGFLFISQDAHAVIAPFTQYKIVGALGSETGQTEFTLNETPYIFMQLPGNESAFTGSFWTDPDDINFYTPTDKNTGLKRWVTLADWDTVKKVGVWETRSNYFYNNGDTGFAVANYTVTPEPLAMTLFLIGGMPIAASLYRKRKKSVRV